MSFIAEFLAQRFVGIRGGVSLNRGARALAAGDGPEAVKWFEDAVSAKSAAMGSATHPTVAKAMTQLAAAHRLNRDDGKAADVLVEAVEIFQDKLPTDPETAVTMNNLAVMLRNTRRHDEAREVFAEALRLMREKIYPDNPLHHDLAAVAVNAARNELSSGTGARGVFAAEEGLRGAVELRKRALGLLGPSEEELAQFSDFENSLRPPEDMSDMGLAPVTDEILATALKWHAEALVAQHRLFLEEDSLQNSSDDESDNEMGRAEAGSSSSSSSSSSSRPGMSRSESLLEEAHANLEEAIAIQEQLLGSGDGASDSGGGVAAGSGGKGRGEGGDEATEAAEGGDPQTSPVAEMRGRLKEVLEELQSIRGVVNG